MIHIYIYTKYMCVYSIHIYLYYIYIHILHMSLHNRPNIQLMSMFDVSLSCGGGTFLAAFAAQMRGPHLHLRRLQCLISDQRLVSHAEERSRVRVLLSSVLLKNQDLGDRRWICWWFGRV